MIVYAYPSESRDFTLDLSERVPASNASFTSLKTYLSTDTELSSETTTTILETSGDKAPAISANVMTAWKKADGGTSGDLHLAILKYTDDNAPGRVLESRFWIRIL